jgi:hypothetical protein
MPGFILSLGEISLAYFGSSHIRTLNQIMEGLAHQIKEENEN